MGIFDKIKEPVILKETSSAKEQLKELEQLTDKAKDTQVRSAMERDIVALKTGIIGEDRVLFELKNSHIPMFVLHDLYLEHEGLSAQIDFLIITGRRSFVIECKNLYGNITINSAGDFIRTIGNRKEGIYSPITQCKRHLELIKQIRREQQNNLITRTLFDKNFYANYRSVVVLANPKTVLNAKYATKDIKNQVIRADQLIEYIRKVNKEADAIDGSESATKELASFFLSIHRPCKTDYLEKYRLLVQHEQGNPSKDANCQSAPSSIRENSSAGINSSLSSSVIQENEGAVETPQCPRCGAQMIKRKASKGSNAGNEFWGCANFPKCRGIINISNSEV